MPSSGLLLNTPFASTIIRPSSSRKFEFYPATTRKFHYNSLKCKSSSYSSSSITDFDLYDLLGIDSSSDQSQIKSAYRSLQKRCHPDIAGSTGHDMAIILNDAYSILSDPISRSSYDKEQGKIAEFRGYTGQPLYSAWFGAESEERAVFVDEIKCVGCLKCALLAQKTFAIESVYGRARVVAQWADPEHKIEDAIQACPVDCIWLVERSDLAALEFLMSKQPRSEVRMSAGNAVGARVSNIFVDVKKFQNRFSAAKSKSSTQDSRESDPIKEARMSAIHAIRSISNWWYWNAPTSGAATPQPSRTLRLIAGKSTQPGTNRLRDAAAARRKAIENGDPGPTRRVPSSHKDHEYWTPSNHTLPAPSSTHSTTSVSSPTTESKDTDEVNQVIVKNVHQRMNPIRWRFPVATATVAAVIVRLQGGETLGGGGLQEHVGGSIALEIVNSSWSPVILAGVTWYLIGMAVVELVEVLRSSKLRNLQKGVDKDN